MADPKIEAFTREFLAYRPFLEGQARRYLHDREDMRDVLQNVWIKASRAIESLRTDHLKAWMATITRREAINFVRRKSRRMSMELPGQETTLHARPDPSPLPNELAERRTLAHALRKLAERSPKQAAAVYLVHLGGFTHAEAATTLGVTEGTAKSNAFKGVERMFLTLTAKAA